MAKSITIEVNLDSKGAVSGIKSIDGALGVFEKEAKKADKATQGLWKQFALGQVAFRAAEKSFYAIANVVGDSVKMAIDAEESYSKFFTVFGQEGANASQTAKQLAQDYILTDKATIELLGSTGDLLTGLGMTTKEALKLSKATVEIGADLSSFGNFSEGAAGAIKIVEKALLGEREQLKRLGISILESDVKNELLRTGMDKLTGTALKAARAQATLNLIYKQSPNAIGDTARTMNSTANIVKQLNKTIEDLKLEMGNELLPIFRDFAKEAIENKAEISELFKDAIDGVVVFAKMVASGIKTLIEFKDIIIAIGTAWAVNFAITKITAIGSAIVTAFTSAKVSAMAFHTVALGVAGVITGVLLKAIDMLNSSYNETKKKLIESTEEFKKNIEIQKQYPAIAKEIQKTETLKFKEELKMHKERLVAYNKESILTQLQREQAKESLNFVKKYGNDSLAENDKIYKSTSELVKIEADRRNKMISMAPGLETVIKKETKLTEEQTKAKEGLIKTTKSFKNIKIEDEFHDWSKEIKEANDNLKEAEEINISFNESVELGIDIMNDASESTKTYAEYLDELKQAEIEAEKSTLKLLDSIMTVSNTAINGLEDLGIISGETAEKVGSLANAGGNLASGIIKGDPVAIFNGAVESIVAIMDIFASKGVDKAIDRENAWMDINDEMKESLKELAEEVGNTHTATSIMLDELMEGEITGDNVYTWLDRINGILSDVDRGFLSGAEAAEEMGDSFEVWIKEAQKLGKTGGKDFFKFLDDLQTRGIEVAEVNQFIVDSLKDAFDGYKDIKKSMDMGDLDKQIEDLKKSMKGMKKESDAFKKANEELIKLENKFTDIKNAQEVFGNLNITVFEDMIAYENRIADNQSLINGIKGAEQALYGMSDAMKLTETDFDQFEKTAVSGYDKLIEQGFTADQSLGMMAPTLYKLKQLQENFGFETDDATNKLIKEADSLGLLKPGPIERMADAMETFINLLSKQLGLVTENANNNIVDMKDNIIDLGNKWNGLDFKEVSGNFGNNMKGFANGTNGYERIPDGPFTVGERGPEVMDISGSRMNVTPNSQMTTDNTRTTNNNYITVDASQFSLQELAEMMNNVSDGNINDFNGTVNRKQEEIA